MTFFNRTKSAIQYCSFISLKPDLNLYWYFWWLSNLVKLLFVLGQYNWKNFCQRNQIRSSLSFTCKPLTFLLSLSLSRYFFLSLSLSLVLSLSLSVFLFLCPSFSFSISISLFLSLSLSLSLYIYINNTYTLSHILSLFILFDFLANTGAAISVWNLNERDLMVAPAIQSENLID